jgi:hypothetical protein
MTIDGQAQRLVELGIPTMAGMAEQEFLDLAGALSAEDDDILVVHPECVAASGLTDLLRRKDKPGFVVQDMTDLDEFRPIAGVDLPAASLYLLRGVERGDEMLSWSPDEALPAIQGRGRTPLTVSEGICWLLQQPEQLEPNHCFMTIGSRKAKPHGLDARTPAIWISGGTGRDGAARRGAPKVGWCWAGNRHTWLGFASAAGRVGVFEPGS